MPKLNEALASQETFLGDLDRPSKPNGDQMGQMNLL